MSTYFEYLRPSSHIDLLTDTTFESPEPQGADVDEGKLMGLLERSLFSGHQPLILGLCS